MIFSFASSRISDDLKDVLAKAFLFFVGLMPAVKYYPVLILLLISFFSFNLRGLKSSKWTFLLIAQYALVGLAFNFYHSGVFGSVRVDKHYVLLLIFSPILICYINDNVGRILRLSTVWISLGLIVNFLVLLTDFFFEFNGRRCHAWGWMFNSLAPAMVMAPLLIIVFHGFAGRTPYEKAIALIALGLSIVSISALSGARMGFYIVTFISLSMVLREAFLGGFRRYRYKNVATIGVTLLFSLLLSGFLDTNFSCNFSGRVLQTFSSVKFTSAAIFEIFTYSEVKNPTRDRINLGSSVSYGVAHPSPETIESPWLRLEASDLTDKGMPTSEATRLALWYASIEAIKLHPILGYGMFRESSIITERANVDSAFSSHNQYLSWLLWGGALTFISGVLILTLSLFPYKDYQLGFTSVFVPVAWALSFITDQPLLFPQMLFPFVITLLIARIMART